MSDPTKDEIFEQFQTIAKTLLIRLLHQSNADAGLFRLRAAHAAYRLIEAEGRYAPHEGCELVFEHHRIIRKERLELLDHTYSRSTVITALTLFDSFLSDLTRFLLLMHPSTIPKDRQVKVSEILSSSSYSEVIDSIVGKYVHELAYKSMRDRLHYLSQTFGIDFSSIEDNVRQLQEYSELRHQLVHNASAFVYRASDQRGQLRVIEKDADVKVTGEMSEDVLKRCVEVANAIFSKVSKKIFSREPEINLTS